MKVKILKSKNICSVFYIKKVEMIDEKKKMYMRNEMNWLNASKLFSKIENL